jgi:hypothetical protein
MAVRLITARCAAPLTLLAALVAAAAWLAMAEPTPNDKTHVAHATPQPETAP